MKLQRHCAFTSDTACRRGQKMRRHFTVDGDSDVALGMSAPAWRFSRLWMPR